MVPQGVICLRMNPDLEKSIEEMEKLRPYDVRAHDIPTAVLESIDSLDKFYINFFSIDVYLN